MRSAEGEKKNERRRINKIKMIYNCENIIREIGEDGEMLQISVIGRHDCPDLKRTTTTTKNPNKWRSIIRDFERRKKNAIKRIIKPE
jgi:hypothetical protein